MRRAIFEVVHIFAGQDLVAGHVVIRDIGHVLDRMTVTSDAEAVVQSVVSLGILPWPRRLFYFDSEGQLSELLVAKDGKFEGFSPNKPPLPLGGSPGWSGAPLGASE